MIKIKNYLVKLVNYVKQLFGFKEKKSKNDLVLERINLLLKELHRRDNNIPKEEAEKKLTEKMIRFKDLVNYKGTGNDKLSYNNQLLYDARNNYTYNNLPKFVPIDEILEHNEKAHLNHYDIYRLKHNEDKYCENVLKHKNILLGNGIKVISKIKPFSTEEEFMFDLPNKKITLTKEDIVNSKLPDVIKEAIVNYSDKKLETNK